MKTKAAISVIIPTYNSGVFLPRCLDSLSASTFRDFEVIVVDDMSTDSSPGIASGRGHTVVRMEKRGGPAAARNKAALSAEGEILFFVDADVCVKPDTLKKVYETMSERPDIEALFGSYDDEPASTNLISQYRNLLHHFVHQMSEEDARTFWAGCGAIRASTFREVGGFDENRYFHPSVEDIELGYRMHSKGKKILLDKSLQVTHLKKWTLFSVIRADIFYRAIPWTRLLQELPVIPKDLNLKLSHRASAFLVAGLVLMVPFLLLGHRRFYGIPVFPVCLATIIFLTANLMILNRKIYLFFAKKRGIRFLVIAIPLHLLYYFYSGASFAYCYIFRPHKKIRSEEVFSQQDK